MEMPAIAAFGVIKSWRNPSKLQCELQFASIWARISPKLVHHTDAATSDLNAVPGINHRRCDEKCVSSSCGLLAGSRDTTSPGDFRWQSTPKILQHRNVVSP